MSLSVTPHCLGNGHDLRLNAAGQWACDACGYVVDGDPCPPAGASAEVNEAAVSVAAPAASGQSAGIPIELISVPGRKARYALSRERVKAHRQSHARLDVTVKPETKASIDSIARELGFSANEVVRELLAFALTNRNWKQVGLVGRGAL
ncbi:hypothetical protein [Xenophilus azovorans]|uniref:hypothetical protein n=1 Tax=Xenophilus azovorans TaxID=151755 RepID=UPI0012EDF9B2|nr:hypothetical protein [Xenophilus azovorans]